MKRAVLTVKEIVIFAVLGAFIFALKIAMEPLPNIHPVAVLAAAYTIVYRRKALYPLYVYVMLDGLIHGFSPWWIPYLYIWLPLWFAFMLVPKNLPRKIAVPVCMVICGLHGLSFGLLYLPFQALMFHFSAKQAIAWLMLGLPFDAVHAASNFGLGFLVWPIAEVLRRGSKQTL